MLAPRMARTRKTRRAPNTELIAARVNKGLSRVDLERLTHVSRETIRLAEAGWTPGPRYQFAIAKALDCRPLDLWPIDRQRVAA